MNYVFSAIFHHTSPLNSLIANTITTSRNFTPVSWSCKIVCKRGLFFDYGWAGNLTYLGWPTSTETSIGPKSLRVASEIRCTAENESSAMNLCKHGACYTGIQKWITQSNVLKIPVKGLFIWRWGTPGRWGNPPSRGRNNGFSRNLTPRNTTRGAFMNKYICVRELNFRLSRNVSLGRLCPKSLIASAATTSRGL